MKKLFWPALILFALVARAQELGLIGANSCWIHGFDSGEIYLCSETFRQFSGLATAAVGLASILFLLKLSAKVAENGAMVGATVSGSGMIIALLLSIVAPIVFRLISTVFVNNFCCV